MQSIELGKRKRYGTFNGTWKKKVILLLFGKFPIEASNEAHRCWFPCHTKEKKPTTAAALHFRDHHRHWCHYGEKIENTNNVRISLNSLIIIHWAIDLLDCTHHCTRISYRYIIIAAIKYKFVWFDSHSFYFSVGHSFVCMCTCVRLLTHQQFFLCMPWYDCRKFDQLNFAHCRNP